MPACVDLRAHHFVIAGERAGVRARSLLRRVPRPGCIMMIGLPARARRLRRGEKLRRTADVLGVEHDRLRRFVRHQKLDEVDEIEPGLVTGRHGVGCRQVAALERLTQMRHEAAALRNDRERRVARIR